MLRVDSARKLADALEREWDLIIADYTMPGFSGTTALSMVRDRGLEVPFIFVSGTIGEEIAVEAMKNGADDYIIKTNLNRLIPAINRELRDAQVRYERSKAEERIRHLAYYDSLTDLPNSTLFQNRLEMAVANAQRVGGAAIGVDHGPRWVQRNQRHHGASHGRCRAAGDRPAAPGRSARVRYRRAAGRATSSR